LKEEAPIVGLDIGTSKVTAVVGVIQEGMIHITGIGKAPNAGLRKGTVVDIEETVSAISAAIDDAQTSSGFAITDCLASISGNQIVSVDSKGVIAVSRADGEIQETDIERVTDSANSVALPPNFEILHSIPKTFIVDGQSEIRDPIGMSGIRLEVLSHVVGATTSAVKNLSKAITQSGLEISGIVFSPLACAKAYLNKKQKEIGTMIIDLGCANTSVAVFEENALIHTKVIPIGSNHITNDIAIGLKISIDAAEKIKVNEIEVSSENVDENKKIDLSKYEKGESDMPSVKYVCEIAEARLGELFGMIKDELKTIERDEMLPAGAVLVGGGAKLKGIQQFVKKVLNLPVQIGAPVFEVSGIVDKIDDPEYSTAVGLVLWGIDESSTNVSNRTKTGFGIPRIGNPLSKIKDIFKNLIP
jgi:cell division protein FtsA